MLATAFLLLLLGLIGLAFATGTDPTWPNDFDDLEEIMYQVFSFGTRGFADAVSPCDKEGSGPGRFGSAEWLRTGFHDMAPANNVLGTGGLDASLQYELDNDENGGPTFRTTLRYMSSFVSKKTSLADLIALGVYTSVRSCGGPAVPVRYGRVDATSEGATGVPQVRDSLLTFEQQFDRMGFNSTEMIQLVACGHTIGGVHSSEFPGLVPPGTVRLDVLPLDSTPALFDTRIATDYLNCPTVNPLIGGPAVALDLHSDFKIFNSDNNVTMTAMTDKAVFDRVCSDVLGRMIDVVPKGVTLTAPIEPYDIKPVDLQLLLNANAATLQWTGYIRVRTTELPVEEISSLTITYKDRYGGSDCGGACSFSLTHQGNGTGFDDTFAFFHINKIIPASSGISSFTVTIDEKGGTAVQHNNNGASYPMQDAIVIQRQQSCLLQVSGTFTLTVAVRDDVTKHSVTATITHKCPQSDSPVPRLDQMKLGLTKGKSHGMYTLFSSNTTIPGGLSHDATFDIAAGNYLESFRRVGEIGSTCRPFSGGDRTSMEPPEPPEPSRVSSDKVPVTESEEATSATEKERAALSEAIAENQAITETEAISESEAITFESEAIAEEKVRAEEDEASADENGADTDKSEAVADKSEAVTDKSEATTDE